MTLVHSSFGISAVFMATEPSGPFSFSTTKGSFGPWAASTSIGITPEGTSGLLVVLVIVGLLVYTPLVVCLGRKRCVVVLGGRKVVGLRVVDVVFGFWSSTFDDLSSLK